MSVSPVPPSAPVLAAKRAGASAFRRSHSLVLALLALGGAFGCDGCLKRQPRDSVPLLGYPTCAEGDADAGAEQLLAEGELRAGPTYPTPGVVERYRFVRRACHIVATVRQEWSRQIDDVEVVYDLGYRPIRAWKRMSVPGPGGRSPLVDIRRYEFRTLPISMTVRNADGLSNFEFRRRERPVAVVGPGRGLLTAWIRAQSLEPDGIVRGPVLDFRQLVERIDTVALRRETDRSDPAFGGNVRVYTVFGRESVMTDATGAVVGDLAGLRPSSRLGTPAPAPMLTETPPDPVGTP